MMGVLSCMEVSYFSFCWSLSVRMAMRMTKPRVTCCPKVSIPIQLRPVLSVNTRHKPRRVPQSEPFPPLRLVPPMTTLAITASSSPMPTLGLPEPILDARITPASPDSALQIV